MIRFSEVDANATELVKSFSEDPKKTGIDDFMRELLEFLKRFDRAQRENTARELKVSVTFFFSDGVDVGVSPSVSVSVSVGVSGGVERWYWC